MVDLLAVRSMRAFAAVRGWSRCRVGMLGPMRWSLLLLCVLALAAVEPAHPLVIWDTARAKPGLSALHGRIQVMLFHQPDPEANKWFGGMLDQVTAAYASEPRVALVFIAAGENTDAFVAPEGWLAASDPTKALMRALTDVAGANRYAIVDPAGAVVATGNAREHKPQKDGWKHALARHPQVTALLAQATPPWPDGALVPTPALRPAMALLLAGDLAGALAAAAKAGVEGKPFAAAVVAQRRALVAADAALLADTSRGQLRFQAWRRLTLVVQDFAGTAAAKDAAAALKAATYDAKPEQAAWTAWLGAHAQTRKMKPDQAATALADALDQIVARCPGTWAALLAASAAKQR